MKRTTIVTAKILDCYAELIERGVKHYEVRADSLEGIDAIHLISAETVRASVPTKCCVRCALAGTKMRG